MANLITILLLRIFAIFLFAINPSISLDLSKLKPVQLLEPVEGGKLTRKILKQDPEDYTPCGEKLVLKAGDHGIIQSPNYPNNYKPVIECEYDYQSPPSTILLLTIWDLRTQNAFFSEISDSIYLSLNGNWSNSKRLSGELNSITPTVFVTETNYLGVKFISSPFSSGGRGFRMGYFVQPRSNTGKPAATEPAHDVYTVVSCNYAPVDLPQIFPSEGISKIQSQSKPTRSNPNPFLVAMILDDNQFCSGTLISDRHVVTSAHCTRGTQKLDMIFGTDQLDLQDSGVQRRTVNREGSIYEHPHFDPQTGHNDISIVKLDQPVEITTTVHPASLPPFRLMPTTFTGSTAQLLGWSDTATTRVLLKSSPNQTLTLAPNTLCTNPNSNGHNLCSNPSTRNSCQLDSGSPVISRGAACAQGPGANAGSGDVNIGPVHTKPPQSQPHGNKPNHKPNNKPHFRQANLLLGLASSGSCSNGLYLTRITAHLDFINRFVTIE